MPGTRVTPDSCRAFSEPEPPDARWLSARSTATLAAVLALAGCVGGGDGSSFLDPQGPVAAAQREHLLDVIGLLAIVVLPVFVLTPLFVWRYRYAKPKGAYRPVWEFALLALLVPFTRILPADPIGASRGDVASARAVENRVETLAGYTGPRGRQPPGVNRSASSGPFEPAA